MRFVVAVAVACLIVPACSDSPLVAYAEDMEALVTTMNDRLDGLDAVLGQDESVEKVKRYAEQRMDTRNAFLADLRSLEPPAEVADLHDAAVRIMGRLVAAEGAMAAAVAVLPPDADVGDLWNTPEGVAARAADEEAIAICDAAQAHFDDTGDQVELTGTPWIPSEMRAVIQVALGCHAELR